MQHLLGAFPRIRAGIDVGVCRPVHEIESTDSAEVTMGQPTEVPASWGGEV